MYYSLPVLFRLFVHTSQNSFSDCAFFNSLYLFHGCSLNVTTRPWIRKVFSFVYVVLVQRVTCNNMLIWELLVLSVKLWTAEALGFLRSLLSPFPLFVFVNGSVVFSNDSFSGYGKFTFMIILSGMRPEVKAEGDKQTNLQLWYVSFIACTRVSIRLYFYLSMSEIV